VSHFQAEGDYVRTFTGGVSHLLHVSLTQLEERRQLPFLRIHRSHMINVDCVQRAERHGSGMPALKKMMR